MIEQDFIDRISFHPEDDIIELNFDGLTFTNSRETDMFYDIFERALTKTGRTWYFLSRMTNCTITPGAALQFSLRRAHAVSGFSRGTVRYGASDDVERAMASLGSDPKTAKNSFANRDEALQEIEEMKAKGA